MFSTQITKLTCCLLGLFALISAQAFSGEGYVIPVHDTSGIAYGCLNVDGLWTTDSANCAVYTGVATIKNGSTTSTYLSTSVGNCSIAASNGAVSFGCASTTSAFSIGVYDLGDGPVLWTGDLSFDFATYDQNPPTGDNTSSLHLWGGEDSGWFYELTWEALN